MTNKQTKPTSYRWVICSLLFFATTINYLDRQVLSLTWEDFIRPEFHWTNAHYGLVAGIFSLVYAIGMLFAGRIVDKFGTKKGYMWSIFIWSIGACLHALCGVATEWTVGLPDAEALRNAIGNVDLVARIANISLTLFILARCVLAIGEAGNFPAAIKATAEYFPKKDRAYATSIFNAGTTIGALLAPFTIPTLAAKFGWEAAFIIIGGLGFIWMGFWQFLYKKPDQNPAVNAAELEYINSDSEQERAAAERDAAEKAAAPKVSLWKCFTYRQTWAFISGKAIADVITLNYEKIDSTEPYEIFDPDHTWKRKIVKNFVAKKLQVKLFENGKQVYESPSLKEIADKCKVEVDSLWDEVKRFEKPHTYYVDLSEDLWNQRNELLRSHTFKED